MVLVQISIFLFYLQARKIKILGGGSSGVDTFRGVWNVTVSSVRLHSDR
jgi:hypothetical protein